MADETFSAWELAVARGEGKRKGERAETAVLERCALDALEAAGLQGLCREGRIEAAVGSVCALCPELSPEQALALVERLAEPD